MTIRITTTRAVSALVLALAYVALSPATPAAADREHQQIMADLRMLQEQTQQLQALMNDLGEALRAVNSRIEDQTSLERKAFADGKVQMDTMSGDLRVVREKVDETNVRLGHDYAGARIDPSGDSRARRVHECAGQPRQQRRIRRHPGNHAAGHGSTASGRHLAATVGRRRCSRRDCSTARTATTPSGNYSLAVQGFESYLRSFPKNQRAHEAQLYVAESLALRQERHGGRRRVRARHRELSGLCLGADGLLQARACARAARRNGAARRNRMTPSSNNFPMRSKPRWRKQRLEALSRPGR